MAISTRCATLLRDHANARFLALLVLAVSWLTGCTAASSESMGFGGGCSVSSSPYLQADERLADGRISYCDSGDDWKGSIQSDEIPAGTNAVRILYAGYPEMEGIELWLRGAGGAHPVELRNVQESWTPVVLDVPPDVGSQPFRIVVIDNATGTAGWMGLGVMKQKAATDIALGALTLALPLLVAHLWCTLTTCLVPARIVESGQRATCSILLLGSAGAFAFFAWWVSPVMGLAASSILLLAPFGAYLRASLQGATGGQWSAANHTFIPVTCAAALVLWLGLYPFSWDGSSWEVPATRWAGLPVDNWLPLIFAQMLESGRLTTPMIGDWLSSDRPPLQAGLYLMFSPARIMSPGLLYQSISTWLQCLILVPVACLLARWIPGRRDRALALAALVFGPVFLVNTLFVWPKLLAATFCTIYHMALFSDRSRHAYPRWWLLAAGLSAALAMLAHGGALFALLGSTMAALFLRPAIAFHALVRVAPLSLTAYAPWVLYQRWIDPPGDRLAKWHFAGQIDVDSRSFMETLSSAYSSLTPTSWWQGRMANFEYIATGTLDFFRRVFDLLAGIGNYGSFHVAWERVYALSFFHFAHGLWFFGPATMTVALALLLLRRRRPDPGVLPLLLATACSLVIWILAMFEPGSTMLHQGAYATPVFAAIVVMMLTWRASPVLFRCLACASILLALAVFAFDRQAIAVDRHTLYLIGVIALAILVLRALSCATEYNTDRFSGHGQ